MLSKPATHLFERAKARFGLEVEVVDGALGPVYPLAETPFRRALEQSTALRQTLNDCLTSGVAGQASVDGTAYRLSRVRRGSATARGAALVSITYSKTADPRLNGLWDEVVVAVLQTDADVAQKVRLESDQSRRLLAMLRFLRNLGDRGREAELARAVVQAAAVWYDVDARVYQRDLKGDYLLYTALPGAAIDDSAGRLNSMWLDGTSEPQGVPPSVDWGQTSGSDVLLVPIAADGREAEWVLTLIGKLPDEAVPHLATLGRIVGVYGELSRLRHRDRVRQRFGELVQRSELSADVTAQRMVGELVSVLNAAGGALTVNRRGRVHCVAAAGSISPEFAASASPPGECLFAPDQFVCAMSLAQDVTAMLELRPVPGDKFGTDAAATTRAVIDILHPFLRGAEPALGGSVVAERELEPVRSVFVQRIEEELERAKRFDLRLSLVLIDISGHADASHPSDRVQDAVRRELRGSDVLGKMNGRMAALLTHTDERGSHRVVERLRRRLAEGGRSGLGNISIGHAVFSADCRTAGALVAKAVRDAAPVVAL